MKLVVALGGNALLRRSETATAAHQLANVQRVAVPLARLAAMHQMVLTHGNGPQVGLLSLQAAAYPAVAPYPLDMLVAETAGLLGYLLEQEIGNLLPAACTVATLLTRVQVDPADPAFGRPSKPVGPMLTQAQAELLARQPQPWATGPDGDGWRRLVASPRPLRVLALPAIRCLMDHGTLVITGGGGGIPVVPRPEGNGLQGVEAVIDKDLCSAMIARELGADLLVIATDVEAVCLDWGLPTQRTIGRTTPEALMRHSWASGSMAPKVEAACDFVRSTGRRAAIGSLDRLDALLDGSAGTQVFADVVDGAGP